MLTQIIMAILFGVGILAGMYLVRLGFVLFFGNAQSHEDNRRRAGSTSKIMRGEIQAGLPDDHLVHTGIAIDMKRNAWAPSRRLSGAAIDRVIS